VLWLNQTPAFVPAVGIQFSLSSSKENEKNKTKGENLANEFRV
jgi:hypothetical protein